MQILCINHVTKWVQIVSGGRRYTCNTKEINGKQFFKFKNEWHEVAKFVTEFTSEFKG